MADPVRIRSSVWKEMVLLSRREPRIECCGLLAGRDGVITEILPARNALASATAYEIAPRELFDLFRTLRENRLTHLGQYHSHPWSENFPSPKDIELAAYPDHPYFIVSPQGDAPNPVRAFLIRDGRVQELEIVNVNP